MFFKKNRWYIHKLGHGYTLVDNSKKDDMTGRLVYSSSNFNLALAVYSLLMEQRDEADNLVKFIETHDKEVHNKIGVIENIVNPKIGADDGNISISPMLGMTYRSVIEDIKNELDDPDTIYAVQGYFPNLVISKYKKELEDSFNYCLRCESGNLALLSKDICFHKKADAIEYQNKIIQKAIQDEQKSKKK